MTPTIRRATAADAAALAELAARTFRDTFVADNRPEDLALHLATAYGPVQQARELADPTIHALVAEDAGTLVAFAQLRTGDAPACVTGPAPIELWRFYLAADWHGRAPHARRAPRRSGSACGSGIRAPSPSIARPATSTSARMCSSSALIRRPTGFS